MDYFSTNQLLDKGSHAFSLQRQKQLAEIFLSVIPRDRKDTAAGRVLMYLAQQALRFAQEESKTWTVSTKSIHMDVGGNPKLEPSAWLSPIWKDIEARHMPEYTPALIQACAKAGLDAYPVVVKEGGRPAYYRLGSMALPVQADQPAQAVVEDPPGSSSNISVALVYKRDLSLQLSWLGRILIAGQSTFTPGKRLGFLTVNMLLLLAVIGFEVVVFALLVLRTSPISVQEVLLLLMALYVGWTWSRYESAVMRLLQDRIMIAPDWALSWKEVGATIEINRSNCADEAVRIEVKRYTSTCPVCGQMVKLDRGEPDYPRRVVGRCQEQPREHVFSFDRCRLNGGALSRIDHHH